MSTPQRSDVRIDPRARKWSARQSDILDTLQALFLQEGFRHLTIGDLVDRLHCSRRTLYSLAPSKEELVLLVIGRLLNEMGIEARATALSFEDPGDAIAAFLQTAITTFEPATAAFTEDLESYLPTKHLYDRHLMIALRVLRELIQNGIDVGTFHAYHPALIAEILDACVERIRRPAVLERAGVSSSEAIAEFSEFIRHGLMRT